MLWGGGGGGAGIAEVFHDYNNISKVSKQPAISYTSAVLIQQQRPHAHRHQAPTRGACLGPGVNRLFPAHIYQCQVEVPSAFDHGICRSWREDTSCFKWTQFYKNAICTSIAVQSDIYNVEIGKKKRQMCCTWVYNCTSRSGRDTLHMSGNRTLATAVHCSQLEYRQQK